MPGELLSLDSHVAAPLAAVAGWQERCGMLLLAAAFLLALRDVQRDLASGLILAVRLEPGEARPVVISALIQQIWILAALGMAVCLFVPFCPAEWLGMSGAAGVAVDALTFLLKLMIADYALWLTGNRLLQGSARLPQAQFLLAGLGALCIFFA
jgi:hypothetical protein